MKFIVRGKIGTNRGSVGRVGQFTYLAETGDGFYIWDGSHKASLFESAKAGLEASERCSGPWFNLPEPASIETVECVEEGAGPKVHG